MLTKKIRVKITLYDERTGCSLFRSHFQIFSRASRPWLITYFPLTTAASQQFSSSSFPSISTKVGESRRSGPPSLQVNRGPSHSLLWTSAPSLYLSVSSSQATSLRPQAAGSALPSGLLSTRLLPENRKTLLLLLKHSMLLKEYQEYYVLL